MLVHDAIDVNLTIAHGHGQRVTAVQQDKGGFLLLKVFVFWSRRRQGSCCCICFEPATETCLAGTKDDPFPSSIITQVGKGLLDRSWHSSWCILSASHTLMLAIHLVGSLECTGNTGMVVSLNVALIEPIGLILTELKSQAGNEGLGKI